MRNYFGGFLEKFKFSDNKEDESLSNQIATNNDDGAVQIAPDSMSQYALNLDWSYSSQAELIETYRETANYNIVDFAIGDIVSEAVSFSEDETPIELSLTNIDDEIISRQIKDKIYKSFEKITTILNLKHTIHRRIRNFYVDGRLAYQKVINKKKPHDGIINIIELDSKFVTKLRAIKYDNENQIITDIEETFIYDEKNGSDKKTKDLNNTRTQYKDALQINPDSIAYVTSGLIDSKTGYATSWLHKAVKPANQLRMMENALVIYRIVRAPERRIFYVDTGNLTKSKAEQYLRSLKNNYRNRMSFDPNSGTFKDDKHLQTMQEDFWLPRNSGGKGTEVTTLPGSSNLGQIDDILYFQKQLYKALNIPVSRLEVDSMAALGRQAEISRDELKFSRFVSSIRKRFNMMLLDLLKTDLILTKILTASEWEKIEQKIEFNYALNQYIEEMRHSELLRDRLDLANQFSDYVGKYVSNDFIRKEILKQNEMDIEREDELITNEKNNKNFMEPEEDLINKE